ncbi:MAG: hypothetical protein LBL96_00305 [Clostridiales bacterium]|jgi:hypothetical protein|nr:hypothetical protein [Clostridiales bacterium]
MAILKAAPGMLGSAEKFDLRSAPFSYCGSYICVLEDAEDRKLYLSLSRSPKLLIQRKNLIRLTPILDNKELPFVYTINPGKLVIKTFCGEIEICFANEQQLRIRGTGKAALKFSFGMETFEVAAPKENGDMEVMFIILGKLLFAPLSGAMYNNGKWVPQKAMTEDFDLVLLPSIEANGFEAAIHEYYSNGERDKSYAPFDECAAKAEVEFEKFRKRYPAVPQKYEAMAKVAAWIVWTHIVRPRGFLKGPIVYMGRSSFLRGFGWQQSYQAMAQSLDIKEAWKLLLNMFDYQDAAGQIPDSVGEQGISYRVSKPALQGLAMLYLLETGDASLLSKEDFAALYKKLKKFAGWWFKFRDHAKTGIPQYYHSDESGFDDATIFKEGVPLQSGDLLSWMILLTEALSVLAAKLGENDESDHWANESKRLLNILLAEFWNGKQFISRMAETNEIVEADSIVALLPIILGKRLPADIIDTISQRLADEDEFLTSSGIVSESLKSSEFTGRAGFMKGSIVSPVQLLITLGLKDSGKDELAKDIATRYCDFACEKGLSHMMPPHEYDLASGLSVKKEDWYKPEDFEQKVERFKSEKKEAETVEPWTSWAAANFLTIAGHILN